MTGPAGVLSTPAELGVILICPHCEAEYQIAVRLQSRATLDTDGAGTLALRTKAAKVAHNCEQPSLGLDEGARER